MKTEIENYFDLVDGFLDKSHTFIVEVANDDCSKKGKKAISLYEVMDFKNIGINGIEPFPHTLFSFTPTNIDYKTIEDIELGVGNLREKGYNIIYRNTAK